VEIYSFLDWFKDMNLWKRIALFFFINNALAILILIDMIAFRYPVFTNFLLLWGVLYLVNKKYLKLRKKSNEF